jgi:hypothetical protein
MYHANGSGHSELTVNRRAAGGTGCKLFVASPGSGARDSESIRESQLAALKLHICQLISHIPYKFFAALCKNEQHGINHQKADSAAEPDRARLWQYQAPHTGRKAGWGNKTHGGILSNRLGIRFHAAIASATGNDELCRVLKNIQDQIWLCRCKTYSLSSSTASEAHLMILKALEENDTKGAQTAMRNHIDHVRTRLIDFLERDSRLKAVEHSWMLSSTLGGQR